MSNNSLQTVGTLPAHNSNSAFKDKLCRLEELLNEKFISIDELRSICITGVPDEGDKRDICWKILLGYLPLETDAWESTLEDKRQLYREYLNEFIVQPGRAESLSLEIETNGTKNGDYDHPLSSDTDSKWQQYFTDNSEVLQQIDKDCRRLFPDYSFFQKPTNYPAYKLCCTKKHHVTNGLVGTSGDDNVQKSRNCSCCSYMTLRKRVELSVLASINLSHDRYGLTTFSSPEQIAQNYTLGDKAETHWEVIERILFIYAKLNRATGYVQGMNELLGPLYHVFATSPNEKSRQFAEADSFFCFVNLMAENRDVYTKTMDNSMDGIQGKFHQLNQVLKQVDWDLYLSLQQQQVHPQFYAFRWLSLLFAQEFHLPDIERLWDTLFSDVNRFQYSIIVAVAMLTSERDTILQGNFNQTMQLLQHYNRPIDETLQKAAAIYQRFFSNNSTKTVQKANNYANGNQRSTFSTSVASAGSVGAAGNSSLDDFVVVSPTGCPSSNSKDSSGISSWLPKKFQLPKLSPNLSARSDSANSGSSTSSTTAAAINDSDQLHDTPSPIDSFHQTYFY